MAKKPEHIHKFKKLRYKSGNEVFFCALPDCSQKINISLALGKRTLCWRCGEPFIMTEYSLRLVRPHCENCHKSKNAIIDNPDKTFDSEVKLGPIETLTLAERLQQTIDQAKRNEEEEI